MKQFLEPIQVIQPFSSAWAFVWRQRQYRVTGVLERWFYRGKWWLDPGLQGESREYIRVMCRQQLGESQAPRARPHPGPYSSTRVRREAPLGPERVMELFRKQTPGGETWILSKVVD